MDLAAIAAELYHLPPAAFTAARNERARQLKTEGQRSLAQQIARLTKPTVSAWAADALAARRAELLERVVDLGAQLRQAQEGLDPDRMRALAKDRARMLPEVVAAARALAEESGVSVSDAAAAEIEQTLRAAMADEQASAAVQSGLLVRALEGNGLEPVDLSGAVAVPEALGGPSAAAAGPTKHRGPQPGGSQNGDTGRRDSTVRTASGERSRDAADRRRTRDAARKAEEERQRADQLRREERAEAEADRDEAAQALDEAQAELAATERDAADAAARARRLTDELEGLRARITELEGDLAAAQREAAAAERARGLAARLVERELRAVTKAQERLAGLD